VIHINTVTWLPCVIIKIMCNNSIIISFKQQPDLISVSNPCCCIGVDITFKSDSGIFYQINQLLLFWMGTHLFVDNSIFLSGKI